MSLPLEGFGVLAITQYGAGPFAMLQLADLGADIIKIENPLSDGDVARRVPPYLEEGVNDSIYFQAFNRNTRSVTLNLQHRRGMEVLYRLVRVSHALYSNLRGDLPTRMGLRYHDLRKFNPAIVICHLTGYGLDNSRSAHPSYDPLIQAESGMMDVTGEPGGNPQRCGVSVVDFAGGYNSAFALVAGMLKAQATGEGCDLDVSLYDTAISMLNYLAAWHLSRGYRVARQADSAHPTQVPSGLFPTKDGWFMLMCAKEEFFERLCDALGRPEWKVDSRFRRFSDRLENRDVLIPLLKGEFKKRTTHEWFDCFGSAIPCAPINDVAIALADPFVVERGLVLGWQHPIFGTIRGVRSAVRTDSPPVRPEKAPSLGQHTDEVLSQLAGYTPAQIKALREQGVV